MASLASPAPQPTPISQLTYRRSALAEWPTWLVLFGHYACFTAMTLFWAEIPAWITVPVLAYLVCLHAHLTHELIHGHPTRNRTVNRWLVPFNLIGWVPYEHYRDQHIAHHKAAQLSHPELDPESYYFTPEAWGRKSGIMRWLHVAHFTLLGRILLGPMMVVLGFWRDEVLKIVKGDFTYLLPWLGLIVNNAVLAYWLFGICDMPGLTVALGLYLGIGLMLVRSYTEHRPGDTQEHRCIIVEGEAPIQLLFLNNCFHLVHHDRPDLPWYEIPRVYAADREAWRARTGGFWFTGYWEILKRTAFTPKDSPLYPDS